MQSLLKSSVLLMGVNDTHNPAREYESLVWIALICSDAYLMVWEVQDSREPVLTVGGKQTKKSIPGGINFI